MGRLTAIVLGSAAGGAFPQWNCRCPVCTLAWAGDKRVLPRTQAGLAVSAGNGRWTLINASPDLGAQIRGTPALHPQGALRSSPIDAVVLTGAEIDQIAGLLSLRESTLFTLYATPASHAAVAANAMFGAMGAMARRAVKPGERFVLSGGIEASLFMVPGKLPLYLEGEDPATDIESAANVGIELSRDGARLVFVPGAVAVTQAIHERFARADAVLFDGTLFTDDEMLRAGTGTKTGRRMGHMPVDGEGGS
jgi:pyrroloquinoline quinone biosynthesis protein B